MAIAVPAGMFALALILTGFSPVPRRRWWRRSGAAPRGAGREAVAREQDLTTRLLAGELTPADYREAMAGLADDDYTGGEDVAMLLWRARLGPAGDDGPRDLLARLGATLRDVPPGVLCSAAVLASTGAGADELMRTLRLTRVEARTVIDAVTTP